MADPQVAIQETLVKEGKYVNNKDDAGGETNFGITKATAMIRAGYFGSMKKLTLKKANEIYIKLYWNKMNLSLVEDQDIANKVFGIGVNCGVVASGKWLQRALNVLNRYEKDWPDIKVDGKIGPVTINVLNIAVKKRKPQILECISVLRKYKCIELAEDPNRRDEFFINGWLMR